MFQRCLIRRLRARVSRGERGFTMIEVAIALVIFGTLILGIATTQSSTMNLIRTDRHRSVAANLAAEDMDAVRATSFTSLVAGRTETTRDIDGVEYTVVRDAQWVLGDANNAACDAPADADPKYLSVNVYVSWPVMSGVDPVDAHTIVTPPVGTYDENTGHIGVKVLDRDGEPVAGIPVTLTGPQPQSLTTTAEGCAFFAFLSPGSYTASVSQAGYVSDQGVPAPSQAATVTVGVTTSVQFDYDQAATLDLTIAGKDLGAPAPASVTLVLSNSHILPNGLIVVPGSGSSRSVGNLFPFADGYGVQAGTCADAAPGTAPVAVQPGTTTPVGVSLPEVRVTVTTALSGPSGSTGPAPGATVGAVHVADASCPAGESFSLGTTDANGQLVFALPWGAWSVDVNGVPSDIVLDPNSPPGDVDGTWPLDIEVIV